MNTLVQKIDSFRRFRGRVLVFLCTNRYDVVDPAIKRRSLADEHFGRPDANERRALLRMDLDGLDIDDTTIEHLVRVTGGTNSLGYTFSDIRTRLLPAALAAAFPDRALTAEDLVAAAEQIAPTPSFESDKA